MSHQKILILDFGSQVTQLIARRVREQQVYCELHPFDVSERVHPRLQPAGHHPLRRPELGLRGRGLEGAAGRLRAGRAGAGHLLRHADHGAATGRQGRKLGQARVRLCRNARPRPFAAVQRHPGPHQRRGPRPARRLDEPRRQGDRTAARLQGHRQQRIATPIAGDGRRGARLLRRAVPSGSHAHPQGQGDHRAASCTTSAAAAATGTCPTTSTRPSPRSAPRSAATR